MTDTQRQTVFQSYLRAARGAQEAGYPINPLAAAGQACHETGFGQSTPPDSNNVLGIKAGKWWTGPTVDAKTHEYYGGVRHDDVAGRWRAYPSVQDCFEDYGKIIKSLWWYEDAHAHADGDPFDYLAALKPIYGPDGEEVREPGYFTDPSYVVNVMKLINAFYKPTPTPSDWVMVVQGIDNVHHVFEIPDGYDVVDRISISRKRRYITVRKG